MTKTKRNWDWSIDSKRSSRHDQKNKKDHLFDQNKRGEDNVLTKNKEDYELDKAVPWSNFAFILNNNNCNHQSFKRLAFYFLKTIKYNT